MTSREPTHEEIPGSGLSRRRLLQRAAAGLPAVAGLGRFAVPRRARSRRGPIVKPLPPEWFIPIDTNAEMRWDAAAVSAT